MVRRVFLAIEISDAAKVALRAALRGLEDAAGFGAGRWVSPERMHLTLRFLGDTEEANVTLVAAAMDRVATTFAPLSLALAGTGFFPNERKPHIAWIGVGGEIDALARLESALRAELLALGIAGDPKPFHPHLTLARVRHASGRAERRALVELVQSLAVDVPVVASDLCLLAAPPEGAAAYANLHRSRLTGR